MESVGTKMKNTKNAKFKDLVNLFQNLRKQQIWLLLWCTLSILLELYFVYLIQDFVDAIVGKEAMQVILKNFAFISLVGVLAFLTGLYQTYKWHMFRHSLMNQMYVMMYRKLLKKRATFFDQRATGDIISAVENDGCMIAQTAGISVLMLVLNVEQIVVISAILLYENPVMGCVELLVCGIYFLLINRINKQMRNNYMEFSQEQANLTQHLNEDVRAVLEIKTLNERPFFEEKYSNHIWQRYFQKAKKIIRLDVTSYAMNSLISIIFPVFMVLLGGLFLYKNLITIGTVLLFFNYTQKMIEPLNNLADFYRGSQMAVGSAERIHEYLFEEEACGEESLSKYEKPELSINIRSFAWKDKTILHNLQETYHGGDKVFIRGESGSGKTTLLKLICGFYEVGDGQITLCGKDVHTIKEEELFDYIKIQFQEPIILEGSLRDNIALGEDYSDKEIFNTLQMVQLKEFALEKGLNYEIKEAGKNLSGGQKQRLALARILIRKPKILILDEATNGVDAENESIITENIKKYVEENDSILLVTSHKDKLREICNKTLDIS